MVFEEKHHGEEQEKAEVHKCEFFHAASMKWGVTEKDQAG